MKQILLSHPAAYTLGPDIFILRRFMAPEIVIVGNLMATEIVQKLWFLGPENFIMTKRSYIMHEIICY